MKRTWTFTASAEEAPGGWRPIWIRDDDGVVVWSSPLVMRLQRTAVIKAANRLERIDEVVA